MTTRRWLAPLSDVGETPLTFQLPRINGDVITRTEAQELATQAGLIVKLGGPKGLDLRVVADPDSQSGNANRARELGTRVMAEPVFWRAIGAAID